MAEPPAKRARHTDSSAMWDREHATLSPRSPQPRESRPADKSKSQIEDDQRAGHSSQKDEDRKRRSRSPRDRNERSRRDRSRSRDRSYRDRDRDRERDRDRGKDRLNGDRRDRDRSRDKYSRDQRPPHVRPHRRSRSRSPLKNGNSATTRTRSPARQSRSEHDRARDRDRGDREIIKPEPDDSAPKVRPEPEKKKDVKLVPNGDPMAVDEDEEDALLRKMMGFTGFNTTHNKKVPGNQIYGVRKEKKTEYRQYMNRVGGFNRPLSPSR